MGCRIWSCDIAGCEVLLIEDTTVDGALSKSQETVDFSQLNGNKDCTLINKIIP